MQGINLRFITNTLTLCFSFVVLFVVTACVSVPVHVNAVDEAVKITRGFVSVDDGQIHYRIAVPSEPTDRPPLVLFHPTPFSSAYFKAFIQLMATDRTVIALDTPGYGDSDGPPTRQAIFEYAQTLNVALNEMGYSNEEARPIDLMGYHTGTLLAVEIALLRPDTVRRLFLPGVPYFAEGEDRETAYRLYANAPTLAEDGSHLIGPWEFASFALGSGLTIEQAQSAFNDSAQCMPLCWWAYHSVFSYRSEERFAQVTQPALLVSTPGTLEQPTKIATELFPQGQYLHINEFPRSGFKLAPHLMANAARDFLDR